MNSEYPETVRLRITNLVIQKHNAMIDSQQDGRVSYYRTKEERQKYKAEKMFGLNKNTYWFQKSGHSATLKLPNTPKSNLVEAVNMALQKTNLPVKILARGNGGTQLQYKLCNIKDPIPQTSCNQSSCFHCQPLGSKGRC